MIVNDYVIDYEINVPVYRDKDFISNKLSVRAVGLVTLLTCNHFTVIAEIINRSVNNDLIVNDYVIDYEINVTVYRDKNFVSNKLSIRAVGFIALFTGDHLTVFTKIINCAINNYLTVNNGIIYYVINVSVYFNEKIIRNESTVFTIGIFTLLTGDHFTIFTKIVNRFIYNDTIINSNVVYNEVNISVDSYKDFISNKFTVFGIRVAVFFTDNHLAVRTKIINRTFNNDLVVNYNIVDSVINVISNLNEFLVASYSFAVFIISEDLSVFDFT